MWRLKIGSDSNGNPFLGSLNNFAGRFTWEFDPKAGTQAERDLAKKAQDEFSNNRQQQQHSADILYRRQYSGWKEVKRREHAKVTNLGFIY